MQRVWVHLIFLPYITFTAAHESKNFVRTICAYPSQQVEKIRRRKSIRGELHFTFLVKVLIQVREIAAKIGWIPHGSFYISFTQYTFLSDDLSSCVSKAVLFWFLALSPWVVLLTANVTRWQSLRERMICHERGDGLRGTLSNVDSGSTCPALGTRVSCYSPYSRSGSTLIMVRWQS